MSNVSVRQALLWSLLTPRQHILLIPTVHPLDAHLAGAGWNALLTLALIVAA
jgi:hypothetical protein